MRYVVALSPRLVTLAKKTRSLDSSILLSFLALSLCICSSVFGFLLFFRLLHLLRLLPFLPCPSLPSLFHHWLCSSASTSAGCRCCVTVGSGAMLAGVAITPLARPPAFGPLSPHRYIDGWLSSQPPCPWFGVIASASPHRYIDGWLSFHPPCPWFGGLSSTLPHRYIDG